MIKYFAYGSNMSREQMKERCPDSKLIGKAVLKNYKLAFTTFSEKRSCGCADIVQSRAEEVWGLLYEVSSDDLKNLDQCEGHPNYYRRFQSRVVDDAGVEHTAEVYEVVHKQETHVKPSAHYIGLMQEAARAFAFPEAYMAILNNVPFEGRVVVHDYSTKRVPL